MIEFDNHRTSLVRDEEEEVNVDCAMSAFSDVALEDDDEPLDSPKTPRTKCNNLNGNNIIVLDKTKTPLVASNNIFLEEECRL